MVFDLPRGSEIEEKSMPKRLQDKNSFQEATKTRKSLQHRPKLAPEIEPSCIKIEVKNEVYLKWAKNKGPGKPGKHDYQGFGTHRG